MALIQATNLPDGDLYLSSPSAASIRVSLRGKRAVDRQVVIWQDTVDALDGGDEAASWLSEAVGQQARLVYCPPARARIVDRNYATGDEQVGFADGFPLLVLGFASVQEINERLRAAGASRIGVERFRPNVVIEGEEPWAEDGWRALHVHSTAGLLRIDIVKPCARCSIISVDPRTGLQGVEPMRTLATYRRRGADVYVAQNALPRGEGRIATGAEVTRECADYRAMR
jgi:uncharacterized protein YcbX